MSYHSQYAIKNYFITAQNTYILAIMFKLCIFLGTSCVVTSLPHFHFNHEGFHMSHNSYTFFHQFYEDQQRGKHAHSVFKLFR